MAARLTYLSQISPQAAWATATASGDITIAAAKVQPRSGKPAVNLPEDIRVALALNDACCAQGKGKVYFLAPAELPSNSLSSKIDARITLEHVPTLFYTPFLWSSDDQRAWRATSPQKRLWQIDSRLGIVPDFLSILPFAVTLHEEQLQKPQLDGFSSAYITVLLGLKPYVGLTQDMRAVCEERWSVGGRSGAATMRYFLGNQGWTSFEQWRVHGLPGVIAKLDSWFATPPDTFCVTYFGSLRRMLIEAGAEAAAGGQPYSAYDGKSALWTKPSAEVVED